MLMSIYLGDFKYFNRYYCGKGIRMVAKAHKKYVFTILVTRDEVQLNMNKKLQWWTLHYNNTVWPRGLN